MLNGAGPGYCGSFAGGLRRVLVTPCCGAQGRCDIRGGKSGYRNLPRGLPGQELPWLSGEASYTEEIAMSDKESRSEAKEETGGKAVQVQRGALAPFKSLEDRFEQMERFMDRMMGGFSPSRWMRPFERDWA